jgi:hypothetical protein
MSVSAENFSSLSLASLQNKLDYLSIFHLLGLIHPIKLFTVVILANVGRGYKWLSWAYTLVYFSAPTSDEEKKSFVTFTAGVSVEHTYFFVTDIATK